MSNQQLPLCQLSVPFLVLAVRVCTLDWGEAVISPPSKSEFRVSFPHLRDSTLERRSALGDRSKGGGGLGSHCATCLLGCSGICREGDQLVVGPTDDGCFLELRVCSIQRNRSACRVLRAGQAATLALGEFDRALLRKVRWEGGLEREHKEKCLGDWLCE